MNKQTMPLLLLALALAPCAFGQETPAKKPAAKKPETKPLSEEQKSHEIEKNYNQALNIYDAIVDKADVAEVASMKRRIETNEGLLQSFRGKLAAAETQRRQVHVNYVNRSMELQRAHTSGDLPEKQFEEMMAKEKKAYERQTKSLDGDIAHYRGEVSRAEQTLKKLRAELKQLEVSLAHKLRAQGATAKRPKPPAAAIKEQLKALSGFKDMDFTRHSLDCPMCAKAFFREIRAQRGWLAFLGRKRTSKAHDMTPSTLPSAEAELVALPGPAPKPREKTPSAPKNQP